MPKTGAKKFVFILIFLHLAIVVPLAYVLNIWADEASTLYTTQHGFVSAFQHAAADEKQAPLYFWVMSLWRMLNGSILFARLFSAICSLIAIKFFANLSQRFFEPRPALLAAAFFAFHPFLIWTSLEIRVYSLVILLTVLLMRFFLEGFSNEFLTEKQGSQRKGQILFLLTAVISLYSNYYLAFLLLGMFAALLASCRWRSARDYAVVMIVVGVAFLPLVVAVKSQFLINTSGFLAERSLFEGLQFLWRHFLTFVLPTGLYPYGDGSPILAIRVWIVRFAMVALAFFAFKKRRNLSRLTLISAVVVFVTMAGLLAAYFLVGSDYVALRHTSVLFVPLIFFIASLSSDIFGHRNGNVRGFSKYAVVAVSLTVLLAFSYSLVTLYPNQAKRGDWARIAEFIRQNESPGQPIVIFTTMDALALPFHYEGVNHVYPDEKYFEFEPEAEFGSKNSLKQQTDFVISEIPASADMIWLAVNEKCLITEACDPLENFVQANYTIEKEQDFYLEKVFLLKKKQQ